MRLTSIAQYVRSLLTKPRKSGYCEQRAQKSRIKQNQDQVPFADDSSQDGSSISLWQRILDKSSAVGTVTAAAGCASCFPALAALAASLGLGFLARFEEAFINIWIPSFAGIALTANVLSFLSHRTWYRLAAGIAGPLIVLATRYLFWTYSWKNYLFYTGLVAMLAVAIWDVLSPVQKVCRTTGRTVPSHNGMPCVA